MVSISAAHGNNFALTLQADPAPFSPAAPAPVARPVRTDRPSGKRRRQTKRTVISDKDILAAIDVAAIAEDAGLQFSSQAPTSKGWRECYSVDREESQPSAGLNVGYENDRGRYNDFGPSPDDRSISFFDLLTRIQPTKYHDWRAARDALALQANISPPRKANLAKRGQSAPSTLQIDQLKFSPDPTGRQLLWYLAQFARAKPPVTVDALVAAGGRAAHWFGHSVLAFPSYVPSNWSKPAGMILYRRDGSPFPPTGKLKERKVHTLRNSTNGFIIVGTEADFRAATVVVKCEGLPDAVAISPHLPPGWIAVTTTHGAKSFSSELAEALRGKTVVIVHDTDESGQEGAEIVIGILSGVASRIKNVKLPFPPGPGKDLRDWLNKVGTIEQLLAHIEAEQFIDLSQPRLQSHSGCEAPLTGDEEDRADDADSGAEQPEYEQPEYEATEGGLVYNDPDGKIHHLCNFTAQIAEDIVVDDGVENSRRYLIRVRMREREGAVTVPFRDFDRLQWAPEAVGSQAALTPGRYHRDHVVTAIRTMSRDTRERRIYAHTGWREIDGEWHYLSATGAIGKNGLDESIEVELPDALCRYSLAAPPTGDELIEAINASLGLLKLAPENIITPILAATYRSAIATSDQTLHLFGRTGVFKSEIAALAQQHFGRGMNSRSLPASWASTANAVLGLASHAKDALLVLDDFVTQGPAHSVSDLHRKAEQILRGQGNGAGRQRMHADTSLRKDRPPRGSILSTGEEIPVGQSLRARLLVLEMSKPIDKQLLTICQRQASDGLYELAMSGFVQWLAPNYSQIIKLLDREISQQRAEVIRRVATAHARTPTAIAGLQVGLRYFLDFARYARAIDDASYRELISSGNAAIEASGGAQGDLQATEDPVMAFREAISSAIDSGAAHLTTAHGCQPDRAERWGWRERESVSTSDGLGDVRRIQEWTPGGHAIGVIDDSGDNLYLIPKTAYSLVRPAVSVTQLTLGKRLAEAGMLATKDTKRSRLTVRLKVNGIERREFWHLKVASLWPDDESLENG